jgi:two-component system CheB/CheR fusion protein
MAEGQAPRFLVVIGASAGGIDALSVLVAGLPSEFAAPIVVAQHLDPSRPSHLQQILARRTPLPVRIVTTTEHLESGVIYVVPANRHVTITDGGVSVRNGDIAGPRPSIDLLLSSAAQVYGEQLIAVVLTGQGADGAAGAREVHSAGGTVIIQNPETAPYPAMPLSLAPTDVDIIANVENIGAMLHDLTSGVQIGMRPAEERAMRTFLDQLRERSGIDFNGYKTPTIMRRLQRRMVATGSERLTDYLRYLQSHNEEYQRLVSSFLIKVTEFFRDAELFDYLRDHVLPELIVDAAGRDNELRLWSAGCATGEEAYSLAILISDLLGNEIDRYNVRIFATDLDNDAVIFARRGIYPASALANMPPELIDRYFTKVNGEFEVKKSVRALTIFGQHDLGQRAPFPRIDLALCRNVLIYFTTDLQKRALQLFAFSLRDGGYLALGKAETTSPLAEYFTPEEPTLKIYRRQGDRILIPPGRIRDSVPMIPIRPQKIARVPSMQDPARVQREAPRTRSPREKAEAVLLNLPVGIVIVDQRYDIQTINTAGRRIFGIHAAAIGEDFVHQAQTVASAPLRAAIDAAFRGQIPAASTEFAATEVATGDVRYLDLACYPQKLDGGHEAVDSVLLVATDVTDRANERRNLAESVGRQREETERLAALMRRLTETNRQLLAANQELSNNNIELRNANEEFLVASEEAQAATEEIETLNEELQATNEELETLNEELQATVEELNTTNDDLQARTVELQDLAVSLEGQRRDSEDERDRLTALLGTSDAAIVINAEGGILMANAQYVEVFGGALVPFTVEDEDRQPLMPGATPQGRIARGESFTMVVTAQGADGMRRRFEAIGTPIRGGDSHGGVITLREIATRRD